MPIQPNQVTQLRMDKHGKEFPSTTKHQQSTIKTNNATPIMAEPNNNHDDQPWEPPVAAENPVDIVSAISASSRGRPDFANHHPNLSFVQPSTVWESHSCTIQAGVRRLSFVATSSTGFSVTWDFVPLTSLYLNLSVVERS